MVQANPLCRLDKPNSNIERQVEVVSNRWNRILSRLEILQRRVGLAAGGITLQTEVTPVQTIPSSLVIHCPVSRPPYALALITPLLSSHTPVFTTTHQHSSVDAKGPTILQTTSATRSQCPLKLTLIYTAVDETKLVLSSNKYIQGEANLLRYIARMFPNNLYESSDLLNQIDAVLDSLASAEGKHGYTKLVTTFLEKNKFLAGQVVSLADLLGLSVVKMNNIATPLVKEWQKRCKAEGFYM